MTAYRTIQLESSILIKERGSRFIGISMKVTDLDSVQEKLSTLRQQYRDATHICYAYRIGSDGAIHGHSDAGEPANSAGLPIYRQLLSVGVVNVMVAVVRYYGGKKLGVPGLIEQYGTATATCLRESGIQEMKKQKCFILLVPESESYRGYQLANRMQWKHFVEIPNRPGAFEICVEEENWPAAQNLIDELQGYDWQET